MYFDIESYTNFDKINAPRTFSIVNGGDVYLNFQLGFKPTNGAQFSLFIDDSTACFQDTNGGKVMM